MAAFRTGTVTRIIERSETLIRARVALSGQGSQADQEIVAAGFPSMLGPITEGDAVVVNTTGVELELGTGGEAFILWNLDGPGTIEPGEGHIVKMRYTPWQTEVMAAEAPESPYHDALLEARTIDGVPVVVCGLHSQLAAALAGVKAARPDARTGYLMTDGAALPLAWSRSVAELKKSGLLDVTCSAGHAFGGDLEAVNAFSGLVALHHAGRASVIVVAMGPGVVGTATPLGFTAMEQGQILDAATALGGRSVAALRISFVDRRSRHVGVSHHTVTALTVAARERCLIAVPELPEDRMAQVQEQLAASGLTERHELRVLDGGPGLRLLGSKGIRPSSMGRTAEETPELFVAAAAAGALAASLL